MTTNYKSPFATSFNNAVKKGVPCSKAVENICKRTGKTPKTVFESLFKAGCCYRQKVNGQWIYWPCNGVPGPATQHKACQFNMWQCFVDWCITSGCCSPEQLKNCCGSQTSFMGMCKKFFGKQVTGFTPVKPKKVSATAKKTTGRTRSTKTVGSRRSTAKSYRAGRKTSTRKYSRAA